MSLYHMYVAGFGPPEAYFFRGTHLLFAMTLIFLLYPLRPGGGWGWRLLDLVMLAGSWAFILHILINYDYVTNRIIYIDELTLRDKIYAALAILLVLEATRRVLGWGAVTHGHRLSCVSALLHQRQAAGADGAALSLDRGHIRLNARRLRELRDAVRAVRRLHGEERCGKALHGFRSLAHRPYRRRAGQSVDRELEPFRYGVGKRGGERDGGRADDDPA